MQERNAELYIVVTPSGIVTLFKLEHPEKADIPIPSTLSGIMTLVIFEQL